MIDQCRSSCASGLRISKPTFDASKTGWRGTTRVDRRFLRASAQVVVKCLLWVESGLWRVGSGQGNEARQVILCKAAVRVLGAVGSRRHANQGLLVAHSAVGIGDSPL